MLFEQLLVIHKCSLQNLRLFELPPDFAPLSHNSSNDFDGRPLFINGDVCMVEQNTQERSQIVQSKWDDGALDL